MDHSPAHQEFSNKKKLSLKKRGELISPLFFFVFLVLPLLFPQERFFFTIPLLSLLLIFWFLFSKVDCPENYNLFFIYIVLLFFISIFYKPNFFSFYYEGLFYFYLLLLLFFINIDYKIKKEFIISVLFFLLVFHAVFSFYHIYYIVPKISHEIKSFNIPNLKERLSTIILKKRLRSLFPLPSEFAFIFAPILFLTFHYTKKISIKERNFIYPILSILGFIVLLFTKSFEIIVATIFIFLFLFLTLKISRKEKEALLISGFFLTGSITALLSFFRWDEFINFEPLLLRLKHWHIAVLEFIKNPVFGVGLGNFGPASTLFLKPGYPESKFAHNFFLQTIAEKGTAGLILLAAILYLTYRAFSINKETLNKNIMLYIALIFILTYSFFDIGIYFESFGIITVFVLANLIKANKVKTKSLNLFEKILIIIPMIFFSTIFFSYSLSKSAKFTKKIEKKETLLENALKIYNNNTDALYQKYEILLKKQKYNKAFSVLERILELDPLSLTPKKENIKMLIYQKRFNEAYNLLEIYSKIYPYDNFLKKIKNELKNQYFKR